MSSKNNEDDDFWDDEPDDFWEDVPDQATGTRGDPALERFSVVVAGHVHTAHLTYDGAAKLWKQLVRLGERDVRLRKESA